MYDIVSACLRSVVARVGWHWVSFLGHPSLLVYKVRLGSELLAEKSMKKLYCRSLVRKKDFDFSLKWQSCLSISVVHFKLIFDQHVDHFQYLFFSLLVFFLISNLRFTFFFVFFNFRILTVLSIGCIFFSLTCSNQLTVMFYYFFRSLL